ncbi:Major Facilitator Superfamily (MFS) [Phytophthora cinnamomi]|uniref:Major Facilitator Superfamily (MFS) n=1 Tax=Phytophthora cinnamomi TaxID=4785 RepID=UPI00355A12EF|nr:Major Facilitator Superfamily (MFS) [Phytophthora cinnamomi]
MSAQVVTSLLILAFVACGVLYDALLSPQGRLLHSQAFRWRRLQNWFPMGVAYAAFYMARYNVAAGNVSAVREKLGFTSAYMGWVLSAGSWAYAISGPFTGQITDRIGGKRGMLIACLGAAVCNLLLGVLFLCNTPGVIQQIFFIVLYAANVLVQGFGTSAVVKINAAWYAPSERGLFAGVFNIMLTSGYFLALGTGSSIIGSLGWPYVFVIPGAVLFEMALVISRYVKNSPSDTHNFTNKQLVLISPPQQPADALKGSSKDGSKDKASSSADNQTEDEGEKIRLTPKQQMKELMRNYTFLGYLVAVFFLCWARDGFLNWFLSFFDAVRESPLTASDTAIIGGAWTVGGFVGGILCGWLSDVIFHSDRVMPIFIFSLLQAFMLGLIYFVSATCSVAMLGGLIFLSSVFLLGNYTLLSYTVPSDLPRDIAAGASGIMTAVGYFSTGLSGAIMGGIIDGAGYSVWALSLMAASVLAGVFTKLGSYFSAKRPKHHAVIAPVPPKIEERTPLAPDSSDN